MPPPLYVFSEQDIRALREVVRAYRAGLLRSRPRSARAVGGPAAGYWARLKSEGSDATYTARWLNSSGEEDADTGAPDLENLKEVNGVEGLPTDATEGEGLGAVVWIELDTTNDPMEWRFEYGPPAGTADKQMLAWDHDPGEWDLILPDGVWIDVDLATGKLKHIGPGPECYMCSGAPVCGASLDAVGQVRWLIFGGVGCVGPCA